MIDVILIRPKTPANIGFICRVMANFSCQTLILIDPLCDIDAIETKKTAKKAKYILEKCEVKNYGYLENMKSDYDTIIGTTSVIGTDYNIKRNSVKPKDIAEELAKGKKAIVFGNEAQGLNNKEISVCDMMLTIPTHPSYDSLNISHACAIILYEIYTNLEKEHDENNMPSVTRKEKNVIHSLLDEILEEIEFSTEHKKNTQRITWQTILSRAFLKKREAFVIIGLLRKIKDKIRK